jgi:UDP-apiose/xylose synthase
VTGRPGASYALLVFTVAAALSAAARHGLGRGVDMVILALGAGGFIGAHLTERLLSDGHNVIAVDVHSDKLAEFLDHPRLLWIEADIRDPGFDLDALAKSADLVIDLIAYANPGLYVSMPLEVFHLNFTENLKIADSCVRHRKRLIQFSSCEVYGKTPVSWLSDQLQEPDDPAYATFSEDHSHFILGPVSKHRWIYSCAKQLLERVLHAYGMEDRLNYSIIRPFNFVGPKIDYLPDDSDGIPRVFSYFMQALLTNNDMQLVDGGNHRRCYTYIGDAVDCIARIVDNPGGACDRQIFNIGTPHNEVSIAELAHLMRDIYQEHFASPGQSLSEVVTVTGEQFYGVGYDDSDRRIPDISKAQTLLGWQPSVGLREAFFRTMQYYTEQQSPRTALPQ